MTRSCEQRLLWEGSRVVYPKSTVSQRMVALMATVTAWRGGSLCALSGLCTCRFCLGFFACANLALSAALTLSFCHGIPCCSCGDSFTNNPNRRTGPVTPSRFVIHCLLSFHGHDIGVPALLLAFRFAGTKLSRPRDTPSCSFACVVNALLSVRCSMFDVRCSRV